MKNLIVCFFLAINVLPLVSSARGIASDSVDNAAKSSANNAANNNMVCDCSANYTPTETSLIVKNETKKMLRSRITKIAGVETEGLTYYFVINENKTFSVIVNIAGTQQYDFRAGTFQSNGDTLTLNYYKNITSAYVSDKAVIDNDKNEIYFLNEGLSKTPKLKMLNHIPHSLIVMLFRKLPENKNLASTGNSAASVTASR